MADGIHPLSWLIEKFAPVPDWYDSNGPINMPVRQVKPMSKSNIGDMLARRFEGIGFKPIPGCPCKDLQAKLNGMTPEAVMSDLPGLAVKLRSSVKRWKELKVGAWNYVPAPPLWLCKRVLEDAVKEVRGLLTAEQLTDLAEPGTTDVKP